jgi:hypothetical protein
MSFSMAVPCTRNNNWECSEPKASGWMQLTKKALGECSEPKTFLGNGHWEQNGPKGLMSSPSSVQVTSQHGCHFALVPIM